MAVSTQMHSMHAGSKGPQKGPASVHSVHGHPNPTRPNPAHPTPPGHAAPLVKHPPLKNAHEPARKGHGLLYTMLVLAVLAAGGGYFWVLKARGPAEPTPEALVTQMEDTLISAAPAKNIYGGMIFSDHGNPPSVTVAGIPNKACVSAGWRLARTGVVTINGVMPERISAAILAEICNQGDANAISWSPK
ncbi:MAG: hypothetical protein HZA67_07400 [Rhodospirillales bacterium]|jgi:hypothetical protein|nr:hypothetical protein [Rhodospirillales bacterium]